MHRSGKTLHRSKMNRGADILEPEFGLNLSTLSHIALKARELGAQEEVSEPDYGSNATDDHAWQVLEAFSDDSTFEELKSVLSDLNEDEQAELIALAWVGRGDFDKNDWDEALQTARDEHDGDAVNYILSMAILSGYLEEGLAQFGISLNGG